MAGTVWMVAGNKGGVGKSVVAKAIVPWLLNRQQSVTVVDGDHATADVAAVYEREVRTVIADLGGGAPGWAEFTDWLCAHPDLGDVVVNLPDAVTERTLAALERYRPSVDAFGFRTTAVFVMNTLPDGLELLPRLIRTVHHVIPARNLHFGRPVDFAAFNSRYARHFPVTLYIPPLSGPVMNQIRADKLSYSAVLAPGGTARSCTTYARIALAEWLDAIHRAFDECLPLQGDLA